MDKSKAQSAMEYIMTYGWAVALVGIALAVLILYGVFSLGTTAQQACFSQHPYYCQNPVFGVTNTLSLSLAENSGSPYFDVKLACTTSTNPVTNPQLLTYKDIKTFGASSNAINSGQKISLYGIPCYTSAVSTYSGKIGSSFSATIWITYDNGAIPAYGSSTPILVSKVATLNLVVT
ncbi:MAG: hypothetical protein KGH94_03575 [Candidatus Micrarchaeota archaeon]|nr:hypothetical protein [Candidatus Micrarchaeota archaeon]